MKMPFKILLIWLTLCYGGGAWAIKKKVAILLAGESGQGKTSLLNSFASAIENKTDFSQDLTYVCEIPEDSKESQTMESRCVFLTSDEVELSIIDTKGFSSTDGESDDAVAAKIAKTLEDHEINALAMVIMLGDARVRKNFVSLVNAIKGYFPEGTPFFEQITVIVTKDDLPYGRQEESISEVLAMFDLEAKPRFYFSNEAVKYKPYFETDKYFEKAGIDLKVCCARHYNPSDIKKSEQIARAKKAKEYSGQLARNAAELRRLVEVVSQFPPLGTKTFKEKRMARESIKNLAISFVSQERLWNILAKKLLTNKEEQQIETASIEQLQAPDYLDVMSAPTRHVDVCNPYLNICQEDCTIETSTLWRKRRDVAPTRVDSAPIVREYLHKVVQDHGPGVISKVGDALSQAATAGAAASTASTSASAGTSGVSAFMNSLGTSISSAAAANPIGAIVVGAGVVTTAVTVGAVKKYESYVNEQEICENCQLLKSSHREIEHTKISRRPEIDAQNEQVRANEITRHRENIGKLIAEHHQMAETRYGMEQEKIEIVKKIKASIAILEKHNAWEEDYIRRVIESLDETPAEKQVLLNKLRHELK